jgi:hypothetical protein
VKSKNNERTPIIRRVSGELGTFKIIECSENILKVKAGVSWFWYY